MATKIFIEKAEIIHGKLYNYSEVAYTNAKTKVNIRCKDHGVFEQTPNCHLVGSGCPTCAKIFRADNRRSNIKDFIKKARVVHGEKYDYSGFEYVSAITKGIILCKVSGHGPFEMQPNNHLSGKQCSKCSGCYKPTTEEYIENAKRIHGEKYDYLNTVYIDSPSKIKIICKIHGEFQQSAGQHLQGNGCNACVDRGGTQRYDTEMFIERAKEVHGETYSYLNVKYENSHTKVIITCIGHGDFEQNPASHLRGVGCILCSGNKKKDTEKFIEEASAIHGEKYDYSNVVYMGAHEKVSIICRSCDREFEQVPTSHTRGKGCFNCAAKGRGLLILSNTDEFIEKSKIVHGEDTYDYSDVVYINSTTPVKIHCNIHGEFTQAPTGHISGYGCKQCGIIRSANSKMYTTAEFVQAATKKHNDRYDYSNLTYVNGLTKVKIICETHGEFEQVAGYHLQGNGCPMCTNKTEGKLYASLKNIYPTTCCQYKREWCKKVFCLPYDFCIPELNILIELDGPQHFTQVSNWKSPEHQYENDKYKEECANKNGFSVIRLLQEDVFYDTYDWFTELCNSIDELKKQSDFPRNLYLCKNEEYA
jgi:very-short-patch-repair endonuclease